MKTTRAFALTVAPVAYWWPRERLASFYDEVAASAADTVVLGETVCARRREMKPADWIALGRELAAAGKEVVLATQTLIESEADLRMVEHFVRQDEFLVEAGDASALQLLTEAKRPFVIGPHLNVYSAAALAEYRRLGAMRWVAPVELSIEAVGAVTGAMADAALPTEVFAFGRLPLAFSARCFTARHHRLAKDQCEFRCRGDADGLLLSTSEREPFLVLNGTQVQSAAQQCLIGERAALQRAGVTRARLSPCSQGFGAVIAAFDGVLNHGASAAATLIGLDAASLPGGLANGFAHGRAGLDWSAA